MGASGTENEVKRKSQINIIRDDNKRKCRLYQ